MYHDTHIKPHFPFVSPILRHVYMLIVTFCMISCNNPSEKKQTSPKQAAEQAVTDIVHRNILFFGNSLTAGYGLDDPSEAFPALIQEKNDSSGLDYQVINAGLSGETSAAGAERIDWLLKQRVDIFVLELGANDGLRGISPDETYKNLQVIINKVKTAWPDCRLLLTGMLVPPSMGNEYATKFRDIFPTLAKANDMAFVPFLLQDVAGITDLNQGDGIHPTAEGQQIMARHVWEVLKELL